MTISSSNITDSQSDVLSHLLGLTAGNRLTVVEAVDEGLNIEAFERVADTLGVTEKHLAALLRITPSTLARRKRGGSLSVEESERLYRMAFLTERAVQVLGELEAARRWLSTAKRALGGETPLTFSRTEPGVREVEDLLGRIEYGIPS